MKKVLILPFLQISSGHHQAANAMRAYLNEIDDSVEIKIVDIFNYTSCIGEQITSTLFLKALKLAPSFYSSLYRKYACLSHNNEVDKRYFLYDCIFLRSMKKLLEQEYPDIIICTHCLPSYLLNLLKKREHLAIPVINAYTDYFINSVWGISYIDLHLVPNKAMKQFLELHNVPSEKIAVTGIPVHPQITKKNQEFYIKHRSTPPYHVLVSGGNLGVGQIEKIFINNLFSGKIKYFVLCGKNQNLFKKIEQLQNPFLIPIPYISLREEMDKLYEQMDLMLSKPGGITVSECLRKEIPLCLLDALPGPEERNQQYLLGEKLSIKIDPNELERSLLLLLESKEEREKFEKRLSEHINLQEDIRNVLKNFIIFQHKKATF